MPFFGFLGGIVFASLLLIVVADRRRVSPARRFDLTSLPAPAYLLLAAYVVLFAIMWVYFFDGVLTRVLQDYPRADLYLIFRSFLFQMEQWDFIVALLAFIVGGLLVLAMDRAAGAGSKLGPISSIGAPDPKSPASEAKVDGDGIAAAAMRQLRRITALNLLLVFALILVTLPALLPWVERRLDFVKVGSFEARLAPLAENTRRTGAPDTPAISIENDLSNYLGVSESIDRVIRVMETVPEVAGGASEIRSGAETRESYELTKFFFTREIVPRVVKMLCMSKVAGVSIPDVPGARESASALLSALSDVKVRDSFRNLHAAVLSLSKIDSYYDENFSNSSMECYNRLRGELPGSDASSKIWRALYGAKYVTAIDHQWNTCLTDWASSGCNQFIKNGYTVRFILEFVKLSSRDQGSMALFRLLETKMLDGESYNDFGFTEIDSVNIQFLKTSYLAGAQVLPEELIEEHLYLKEVSSRLLESLTEACDLCPSGRRPKKGVKADYESYRKLAEWYADANAVISIGMAMLRRMPLNRMHASDSAALRKILTSAIRSRDEIQDVDGFRSNGESWAAAMLDEGVSTIRYVQMTEDPESLGDDFRSHCNGAKARLRSAVERYKSLQRDEPEHRINRMRAERTLVLVEQQCD